MQCPKCQFENPEGMKFCGGCGAKLERICSSCNSPNPSQFKYCGECGHKLDVPAERPQRDLSYDQKIEKIQKYLPEGLTEKILSQKDRIEGERKHVTVMFCDMEGFTQLAEKLGPEEAYSVMDQVYELLIHKVHDYEGTVNEMTGDGIMALFGAPIALEDAPQRAIRSAYSVHREIARFSERLKQEEENIPSLKMRIGIHTGPVVVGTVGNDLRVEFKAVGDTVNLASRMEGLAEPGTTYITEDTFKLTEGLFRFEALGVKQVKGKKEPIKVYRVIAPSTRRTRFDVSAERGLTAFIGRERELELLLDGFKRAKEGRGQAFSIMAEAGIGKSRLLYEFRKAVANEDVTFLEGKCLSYSSGMAYYPVIDILKSNFDVLEDDGDSQIREKVERQLKLLGIDKVSTLPYLLELLSVKDSGIEKIPMSAEARKDRIMEAVKRITLRGSEKRPVVLAFEDLHWIDKSSEEYLKDFLNSISGARVFLIFTYRPEFVHSWGGRSYHSQVNLNRLSNRESLAMVYHILGTDSLDREIEELILQKTEGVPFFIEEFIRSLKDLKLIQRRDDKYCLAKEIKDLTIPTTIQDVIMARVDSLPEVAKEVLQTGAVIDREFSFGLIQEVTDFSPRELLSHLSTLKESELLYERGIYPDCTYVFKHALTREVVYDSILTLRRKKIHNEIGKAIEMINKDTLHDFYGILAEHFIEGEDYEKGAGFSRLAASQAIRKPARTDAISFGEKAVFCLERLPKTNAFQRKIIDARAALANYYVTMNRHIEAKDAVMPIVDPALEMNYQKRLPGIFNTIGSYFLIVEEEYSDSVRYLEKAVKIAEKVGDNISLILADIYLGCAAAFVAEFEKGLEYYKQVENIGAASNNKTIMASAKSLIVFDIYAYLGKINLAHQTAEEALRLAEDGGDEYFQATAHAAYGLSCYLKGLFNEAEYSLSRALTFQERISYYVGSSTSSGFLGDIYLEVGELGKAEIYYDKAVLFAEPYRYLPSVTNMRKVCLARAKVLNNDTNVNLSELFKHYRNNRAICLEGLIATYIGDILLNIDDRHIPEAEDWIERGIEANKRNGTTGYLGFSYLIYGNLFKRKGDYTKGKEYLSKAIEIFKECGADGWVEKYKKELAEL